MDTKTIPTKTFKEVHEELENESVFLHKNHDIENFKDKAEFLKGVGFENSIAAKLYSAIADNHHLVEDYNRKYHGQYKFILKPQLERVLEKYNLYLRNPKFFLGDIPEKNISDIMKFYVFLEDISLSQKHYEFLIKKLREENPSSMNMMSSFHQPKIKIPSQDFKRHGLESFIKIAAIEKLFNEEAFKESRSRILDKPELQAKNQVDLDPIILFETRHGYIIITAWGDEANDELVVNQNNN